MSYSVYSKVADDFSRTLIASVVGTAFLWWFAGVWRLGAILGFGVIALIVLLDLLQVAAVSAGTAALGIGALTGRVKLRDEKWMLAANLVRVVGAGIGVALLWFLSGRLWP